MAKPDPDRDEPVAPTSSGTQTDADRIQELVAQCLDQLTDGEDRDETQIIANVCKDDPDLASQVLYRLRLLQRVGMVKVDRLDAEARIPEQFGNYRLLRVLGKGGMGVVYLATQQALGREVALKLLRPDEIFFPGAKERFQREVESVAKLEHPHILPVHDFGTVDGIPYFTMKYVNGLSLGELIERLGNEDPAKLTGRDAYSELIAARLGQSSDCPDPEPHETAETANNEPDTATAQHASQAPLPKLFAGSWVETCFRIAYRVAAALAHAHERGILHRDAKSSNILLTAEGEVQLVDFGLALPRGNDRLTRTGAAMGSLPYMAPEQIEADFESINVRTDVYGLGVVLFEALTLSLPYEGLSNAKLQSAILAGSQPAPSELNAGVPVDAETVCLKAFAREPKHRYATMTALREDLRAFLDRRPVAARRMGPVLRSRRWAQRHPTLATALAMGVLFMIGTPLAIAWSLAQQRDEAVSAEQRAKQAQGRADVAAADAIRHAQVAEQRSYHANIAAARLALAQGDFEAVREHLSRCPTSHRAFEWNLLATNARAHAETLLVVNQVVPGGTCVRGTSTRFALLSEDKTAAYLVLRSDLNNACELVGGEEEIRAITPFMPDGTIGVQRGRSLSIHDATTGAQLETITDIPESPGISVVEAYDRQAGTLLVRATRRTALGTPVPGFAMAHHYEAGVVTELIWTPGTALKMWDPVICSDGLFVLGEPAQRTLAIELWQVGSKQRVTRAVTKSERGVRTISSDRQSIAIGHPHQGLAVYDASGHLKWMAPSSSRAVSTRFSQDGRRLAVHFVSGEIRVLETTWGDVEHSFATPENTLIETMAWSADAQTLTIVNAQRIFDFALDEPHGFQQFTHEQPQIGNATLGQHCRVLAFRPGTDELLTSYSEGALRLWDTDSGMPLFTRFDYRMRPMAAAMSDDGMRLVHWGEDGILAATSLAPVSSGNLDEAGSASRPHLVPMPGEPARHLVFSPSGRRIAWSLPDGSIGRARWTRASEPPSALDALAASDAPVVAIAFLDENRVGCRRANSKLTIHSWTGGTGPQPGNVPPDALLPARLQQRVWQVLDQSRRSTSSGHATNIETLRFAVDRAGQRMVTGTFMGAQTVWSVENATPLIELEPPVQDLGFLQSLTFNDAGTLLAASYSSGQIIIHDGRDVPDSQVSKRRGPTEIRVKRLIPRLLSEHTTRARMVDAMDADTTLDAETRAKAQAYLDALGREEDRLKWAGRALSLAHAKAGIHGNRIRRQAEALLELRPESSEGKLLLGMAKFHSNDTLGAVAAFNSVVESGVSIDEIDPRILYAWCAAVTRLADDQAIETTLSAAQRVSERSPWNRIWTIRNVRQTYERMRPHMYGAALNAKERQAVRKNQDG